MQREEYERLAKEIFQACLEVHRIMGPGLLESVYEACLVKELELRNIKVERQLIIPLYFKGYKLDKEYKLDLLVEKEIIVEIKSVIIMLPIFTAQIISHLKLNDKRMGFLVNFNVPVIKDGFKRFVNNY